VIKGVIVEQNEILNGLCQAIIDGEKEAAETWANEALREKVDPLLAIEKGIKKALDIVGDAFHRQELFLPGLVRAAEAAMAGSAIMERELENIGVHSKTSAGVVVGTVAGDIHDIGKTLVGTLYKAAGFSVIDLGVNVTAERFVNAVKENKPDILGLSSLLTTTINEQRAVIDALEKAGLRSLTLVLVGGGAATQEWADEIGADGYGEDAAEAVERGKELLGLS
jgi:corrinoid protein of di/trimethylamine methyltransferase